ncbi:MAG TPA: hypothetical protein VFV64_15475 [Permianibacter sp.]|nr:hypothetical protein [Permianibacter sp.]
MLHQIVGQYFWIFCLFFCFVSYVLARRRLLKHSSLNGLNVEHGLQIIKWFWLANMLPWMVMGLGLLSGSGLSVWDYFRPQDGNPLVVGWFASLFLLTVVFAIWVLFMGGAKDIYQYQLFTSPRVFSRETPVSENMIKLIAAVAPFWILFFFFVVTRLDS